MYAREQPRRRASIRAERSGRGRSADGLPRLSDPPAEGGRLTSHRPPVGDALALIVGVDEWCAEALRSVLEAGGYRVVRAVGAERARDAGASAPPDIVLIEATSAAHDGIALCRQMRRDGSVAQGVPVVLIVTAPTTRATRVAGLRAGAWDVLTLPMDAVELTARVGALVQVKREADAVRAEGLLEPGSGWYGVRGLERRAREVWADAARRHHALACVVFGADRQVEQPGVGVSGTAAAGLERHLGATLQAHGRLSDVVGRWRAGEFALLAPGTGAEGARRLAERLAGLAEASQQGASLPPFAVRAGFDALDDAGASSLHARDLLARAHAALQAARAQHASMRICRYTPGASSETS